jgi:hypothetical protein
MAAPLNSDTPELTAEALATVRARALARLTPARSARNDDPAEGNLLFTVQRTDAGRRLPPYYLVYFLLRDLLGFRDLGAFEKLAWSFPIFFEGTVFLVEHRKMGVGVFCADASQHEDKAADLVRRIWSACKAAEPYFKARAAQAIQAGELNIHNHHATLWGRYRYLRQRLRAAVRAQARADAKPPVRVQHSPTSWSVSSRHQWVARERVAWLTQTVIEAFFAWSEHALVHCAVLRGQISAGPALLALTKDEWRIKFKAAFDTSNPHWKQHLDALLHVREENRNYVAHGAFGKDGRAFEFHSGAGATPLRLKVRGTQPRVTLHALTVTDDGASMVVVDSFVAAVRQHAKPQWLYLESGLVTVLTFAKNGYYAMAMADARAMRQFIDHWSNEADNAANMDW